MKENPQKAPSEFPDADSVARAAGLGAGPLLSAVGLLFELCELISPEDLLSSWEEALYGFIALAGIAAVGLALHNRAKT